MQDIDKEIAKWSTDRDEGFQVRGEVFRGRLGLDYELVADYMGALRSIDEKFKDTLNALLLAFLGAEEYARFDFWRIAQRDGGNPLTIHEASVIGAKIVEEETGRPTRASSDSSTGRETSGDGSTDASISAATETTQPASLLAVS